MKNLSRKEKFVSAVVGEKVVLWDGKVWAHGTGHWEKRPGVGSRYVRDEADEAVATEASEVLEASAFDRARAYDLVYRVFPQVGSPEEAADQLAKALSLNDLQEQRLREVFVPGAWDYLWERKPPIDGELEELVRQAVHGSAWPGVDDARTWWKENWYRAKQLKERSVVIQRVYRCVNPGASGHSYPTGPYGPTRQEEHPARRLTFLPEGRVGVEEVAAPGREEDLHLIGAGDSSACEAASKQYPVVDVWISHSSAARTGRGRGGEMTKSELLKRMTRDEIADASCACNECRAGQRGELDRKYGEGHFKCGICPPILLKAESEGLIDAQYIRGRWQWRLLK